MTAVTLTAIALTGETLQRGISRGRSVAGSQGVVIERRCDEMRKHFIHSAF